MTPGALFWGLLAALATQRAIELRHAARNTRALLARGGTEHDARGYPAFVALHTLFFAALVAESLLAPWAGGVPAWWTGACLALVLAAQALRYAAIRALGPRWTTRVITLPREAPVTRGPYRWVRHPNYIAVVTELLVIPLAFGLPATALLFTAANVVLLRRRIRIEEAALRQASAQPPHPTVPNRS